MKVIITGGTGFIGSNLTERLVKNGNEVVIVDKARNDRITNEFMQKMKVMKIRLIETDITNKDAIAKAFREDSYDAVVHLAGKSDVRESVNDIENFENVNVKGTISVLEAARLADIKKIVFASSSSVYGELKSRAFKEDDDTDNHASPYGATKKMAEICCRMYSSLYGIDIPMLRFFTVYGPRGRLNMSVMRFIKSIEEGVVLEVHAKGKIKRDFVYIDDVLSSIEACTKKGVGTDAINIGSGKYHELNKIIKIIEKNMGKKSGVRYVPMQRGDVLSTCADIRKAKKMLGWRSSTSLEEGIRKTVEWWNRGGRKLY